MTHAAFTLTLSGPFLTRGLDQAGYRLDATRARGADGAPILPPSHLRGHLREAVVELLATHRPDLDVAALEDAAARLFGSADQPNRVRGLSSAITPVICALTRTVGGDRSPHDRAEQAWRVAMDPYTRAARSRHLTVTEGGSPGDRWEVKAELTLDPVPGLDPDDVAVIVEAAAAWVRALGRGGNDGWGTVVGRAVTDGRDLRGLPAALDKLLAAKPSPRSFPKAGPIAPLARRREHATLTVELQGPLMVGDDKRGSNVMVGRTDLPGSIVVRALADALLRAAGHPRGGWITPDLDLSRATPPAGVTVAQLAELVRHFGEVRASFGVPLHPLHGTAAEVVPLTTYADQDRFDDLVALRSGAAPSKEIDDKKGVLDDPTAVLGHGFVRRSLLAHVAKDRHTGAARQGMLFVYEAIRERWVDPASNEPGPARYTFDLSAPPAAMPALRALAAEITHLGKAAGRGYGRVNPTVTPSDAKSPDAVTGREARVTLLSEALLLRRHGPDGQPLGPGDDLHAAYSAAWTAALSAWAPGAKVEAKHVFAAHRLRGGQTANGTGAVPPGILTRPGSTFLLTWDATADAAVREALATAQVLGVEDPAAVGDLQTAWGRPCPFRVSNGYGLVRLEGA